MDTNEPVVLDQKVIEHIDKVNKLRIRIMDDLHWIKNEDDQLKFRDFYLMIIAKIAEETNRDVRNHKVRNADELVNAREAINDIIRPNILTLKLLLEQLFKMFLWKKQSNMVAFGILFEHEWAYYGTDATITQRIDGAIGIRALDDRSDALTAEDFEMINRINEKIVAASNRSMKEFVTF